MLAFLRSLKEENVTITTEITTVREDIAAANSKNDSLRAQIRDHDGQLHSQSELSRQLVIELRGSTADRNYKESELNGYRNRIRLLEIELSDNVKVPLTFFHFLN